MPEYDYERFRKIDRAVRTAATNLKKARALLTEAHADGYHVTNTDVFKLFGESLETAAEIARMIPDKHFYYDAVGSLSWGMFSDRNSDSGIRKLNVIWDERYKLTEMKILRDKLENVTVANGATPEEAENAQRRIAQIDEQTPDGILEA